MRSARRSGGSDTSAVDEINFIACLVAPADEVGARSRDGEACGGVAWQRKRFGWRLHAIDGGIVWVWWR